MSLDTTTSDPIETAAPEPQLDSVETNTEAVTENEDTSQTSESEETEPTEVDNSDETELKEWAAKKNLPLDDPLKIAKMYRESEKQLGKKGQKEGQLKAAVTDANTSAGVDDVQALRNEVTALSFYIQHPEAKAYESEMVTILEDKPWLANDLEVVLDAAKGRSSTAQQLVAERQAGKKEALAQAEKANRASQPRSSAANPSYNSSSKITLDNVDELIGRNGQDWFVKNRDKINAVLSGN